MKKKLFLFIGSVALIAIALLFFGQDDSSAIVKNGEDLPNENPNMAAAKQAVERAPATTGKKESVVLPDIIRNHLPTRSPASLQNRWTQKISSEDDTHISTQLTFDNVPVENYLFRWRKDSSGQASELTAGVLPRVAKVNGAFPNEDEVKNIAETAVRNDGDILSTKEVWHVDGENVLSPEVKIEVMSKDRTGQTSGHEYWFVSLNSGKVVKRVEADRY